MLIITFVSTVGILLVLVPGFLEAPWIRGLTRIPKIGGAIESLLQAIITYRGKRLVLFLTTLMTVPVHGLLTLSMFLLARGLGFDRVSGWDYWAIYPISGILSTIPLPAGPAEMGIRFFYMTALLRTQQAGVTAAIAGEQGLILALIYRLTTILIAPIGAAYYLRGGRGEVTEVIQNAEAEGRGGEPDGQTANLD